MALFFHLATPVLYRHLASTNYSYLNDIGQQVICEVSFVCTWALFYTLPEGAVSSLCVHQELVVHIRLVFFLYHILSEVVEKLSLSNAPLTNTQRSNNRTVILCVLHSDICFVTFLSLIHTS